MNTMFERLSLQGHLRRIIDQSGETQGWEIIAQAIERELKRIEIQQLVDMQD